MTTFAEADVANQKALGYSTNEDNSFDEFLTLKSLTAKKRHLVSNPFGANMATLICLDKKELTRNLCVRIDLMTLTRLESVLETLDTNKQEFVLEAIYSCVIKAEEAIKQNGINHIYHQISEEKHTSAGFSVEPSPHHDGFYVTKYQGNMIVNKDAERHERLAGAWTGAAKALSDTIGEAGPRDTGTEADGTSRDG